MSIDMPLNLVGPFVEQWATEEEDKRLTIRPRRYFGGMRAYWADYQTTTTDSYSPGFLSYPEMEVRPYVMPVAEPRARACEYCGVGTTDPDRMKCEQCGAPLPNHREGRASMGDHDMAESLLCKARERLEEARDLHNSFRGKWGKTAVSKVESLIREARELRKLAEAYGGHDA